MQFVVKGGENGHQNGDGSGRKGMVMQGMEW